jgi:hypothetical protein
MHFDQHSREIAIDANSLYDYLTQPSRWPEWHPTAAGASAPQGILGVGAEFEEDVHFLWLRVVQRFRVTRAERPGLWEVEFDAPIWRGSIRYEIIQHGSTTLFTRTLSSKPNKWWVRALHPVFGGRMTATAVTAMDNIKALVEKRQALGQQL